MRNYIRCIAYFSFLSEFINLRKEYDPIPHRLSFCEVFNDYLKSCKGRVWKLP